MALYFSGAYGIFARACRVSSVIAARGYDERLFLGFTSREVIKLFGVDDGSVRVWVASSSFFFFFRQSVSAIAKKCNFAKIMARIYFSFERSGACKIAVKVPRGLRKRFAR